MATHKYISQLTNNTNPILTGYTVFDDGVTTYKSSLNTLRQVLVDSGSHYFTGSQVINGNLIISGSLTAQQYIVSSSITNLTYFDISGSTKNGNDLTDTHQYTGSMKVTGSINVVGPITASYFKGDGNSLTNLPYTVSGTTDHLAFFNTTTSVSSSHRFYSVNVGETLALGTTAYTLSEPERFMVDNGDSYNIATFQASAANNYTQVNIKNFNSGSNSSADLVLWNDVATESSSYVNLGINSSTNDGSDVGYAGDGYLYNERNDLYIGSKSTSNHGHVHIFGGNNYTRPQISVFSNKTIGFNVNIIDTGSLSSIPSSTDGFMYEFSGSIHGKNNLYLSGSVTSSHFVGDGSKLTNLPLSHLATTGSNIFVGNQIITGSKYLAVETIQNLSGSLDLITSGNNVQILSSNLYIPNGGLITNYNVSASALTGSIDFDNLTNVPTLISSSTQISDLGYSTTGSNTFIGDQTINGSLLIRGVNEVLTLDGGFSGNRNFDFDSGSIFYITGLTGNGTWNVKNVPTTDNRAITFTFIVEQGVVPYSGSQYQINDSNVTVKWSDNTIPSGSGNNTDVIGLTAFRIGSSWNVLGGLSTFGV